MRSNIWPKLRLLKKDGITEKISVYELVDIIYNEPI